MTQQTFTVDYGLTIVNGNSITSDTGFTTITGNTGAELAATGVDSGAYVGVEDTISSYMLVGNATAASNIVVSLDQVLTRTSGNVQLNVGDNTWLFTTAALDPSEAYLYVPGGAAITTPNATGGGTGKNIFIEAGAADQSDFYTSAGGELMLKGGRGAFNDGGGGGPGGNVNINAGESADPAGVAGNVYITAGALQSWTFDNTGKLTAPGDITTTGNISAHDMSIGGNINGSANFDIDGNANIGGNLFVTGNINFSGNVTQISGNSGVFFGNTATGVGALYAGKTGYTPVANTIVQITGDLDDYIQVNLQNTNHGNTASMEIAITADDGDDSNNYLDMGIASSTWDGTQTNSLGTAVNARDGYLYVQGGAAGGNLILGTTTAGYAIKFNAGGPGSANTVATISATGISTTGTVTATNIGNVAALDLSGNASTVLFGNGVFAALPGANYGDSNVVTLLSSFGSNTVSTTGNLTGGNLTIAGTTSLVGNITSNGYFISGNQATGGFKLGNVNSRIIVGGGNSYMTLGQNPSIYPDTSASSNAGLLIGGNGYLLAPNGARVLALGNDSNVAVTGSLNLPNGGQVVTTGNVSAGNINTSASITRSGNYAQPAWTTNGIGLKMPTATYTDTTTAAGNLAASYIHTLAAPIMSFTNAVNVANSSTLFVSAPTAGTNATLGNAWAITASGSINATGNIVPDGNIYFTGISASIRSLPGFAGAGSSGTWGVFDHNVPTGGYKNVIVGGGQTVSNSTTNIFLGSQYGICNTTVYGNFVTANSASLGNTATVTTANYQIGYRDIPQIAASNATIGLTDAGKHYYGNSVGNITLSIPTNATIAFPIGTAISIVVQANSNIAVNAISGVSLYAAGSSSTGNRVVGSYGMATLMKVATDTWFINGTGVV